MMILLPAFVGITAATVLIAYAALTAIDLDYRKGSGVRRKRKRRNR